MQNRNNIIIIDRIPDKNWYTYILAKKLAEHVNVKVYAQKSCNIKEKFIKKVWSSYLYFFDISRHILRDRPKVINLQFEFAMFGHVINSIFTIPLLYLLRHLLKVKIVTTLHMVFPRSQYYEYLKQLVRIHKSFLEKLFIGILYYYFYVTTYLLIKASDKIIVHGNIFKLYLSDYISYNEFKRKIEVIPLGIEPRELCSTSIKNKIIHDKIVLLFYGVISPRKGYDEIVRDLDIDMTSSVLIVIAGKVPTYYKWYLKTILDIIANKKLKNVILIPHHIPYEVLPQLYRYATFTVLLYKRVIAASAVLSESLEFCVPVIVTTDPYFYEILGKKYIFYMNNFNIDAIKNYYYLLREKHELLTNTAKYIEIIRQKYSWDNVAKMYINVYEKLYNGV
jgi:glycosyltransferase involved in cell wall biosynthesis